MDDAKTINEWLMGSPYSFPLDERGELTAREMLRDQWRVLQRQQELQPELEARAEALRTELERDFDVRLVYESNAIEGVTTSFPETRRLMATVHSRDALSAVTFRQQVVEDRKLLEVVGHGQALKFVHELASGFSDRHLREVDIRNIHALAMAHEPRIAGHYKVTDNSIAGREELLTARSDDVGYHMRQLVEWLNDAPVHGPLFAAVVHAWLAYMHPFEDGNGRVARLLANYVLYRNGWPCLIVRSGAEREEYYEALKHSDDGGDIAPLFSLFVRGLHRSLSETADPAFARRIFEADLKRAEEFETWAALHGTFTARLRLRLAEFGLRMEVIGWLQASDYLYLKRRDSSGNGWFAKVRSDDRQFDVLLWFGYQSDDLVADAGYQLSMAPSIFISERDRTSFAGHPYRPLWNDDRLAVHEVSLQPVSGRDRLLVRRAGEVHRCPLDEGIAELAAALSALRDDGAQSPVSAY
ncbi:MAG TPA: Fic family protein [Acidimicrobiales bacterium]|nr:Fic family protein [Acidimicrobiales bacterium]